MVQLFRKPGDLLKNVMILQDHKTQILKFISQWLEERYQTQVSTHMEKFFIKPQDRPILIEKIVSYVLDNGFDGVDVDLVNGIESCYSWL